MEDSEVRFEEQLEDSASLMQGIAREMLNIKITENRTREFVMNAQVSMTWWSRFRERKTTFLPGIGLWKWSGIWAVTARGRRLWDKLFDPKGRPRRYNICVIGVPGHPTRFVKNWLIHILKLSSDTALETEGTFPHALMYSSQRCQRRLSSSRLWRNLLRTPQCAAASRVQHPRLSKWCVCVLGVGGC